jgi:DNA-directed RNA polymerase subunit RPC12/RpoP
MKVENDLPFDKVLSHDDANVKKNGTDYVIVYDYTCMACNHTWRLTSRPNSIACPKCRSYKLYYVSKRSCDTFIDQSEIIMPPESSELL